ncbi:alpha-amylase family glycosyl hydrolase [Tunturiibacter lichenicola]|uniref:alpha-amylase family glycosyl hydrolase n=1 Tax=Tunturiibacter lichenicola TaxID=2051959 RepID=UPI003D9B4C48
MEFHISRALRENLGIDDLLFSYTGNIVFTNVAASRALAKQLQELRARTTGSSDPVNAGALFAMGLIDELNHAMVARYRKEIDPSVLKEAVRWFGSQIKPADIERLLLVFTEQFPNVAVHRGELTAAEWLNGTTDDLPNREAALEELLMLWLANINPAFAPFRELYEDSDLKRKTVYQNVTASFPDYFVTRPQISPEVGSLLDALRAPLLASPDSLTGQLDYIREHWTKYLGEDLRRVLLAIDVLREEDLAIWMRFHPPGPDQFRHGAPGRGGEGFVGDEYIGFEDEFFVGPDGTRQRRYASDYQAPLNEYEAFSADQAWMPNVVLMAKSTYVWLEQLSKKYLRHIHRLDQIPDEELQLLSDRGITGLWLIGLWERSVASRTIKRLRGHGDAVASAYSLKEYQIADDLGGNTAYENLRDRAARARIRLASDMVPNHMGIDSNWVIEHPDWFLYRWESPFPVYRFEGPDLSTDSRVEIKIEDHYYDQSDAAVVFRLRHHREGTTRYVYHGNDGTTFAWNDTAQLDYSKAAVREHVIQVILHVARLFPIIRFDAAMVLAKRHVQRLWFPLPGAGGSIPSRAENAMTQQEFDSLMPHEFWREVVDRVAAEVPGTLLLAEAFWLLEGYFVRTLGMHRVYNSAFMNMLRDEENSKYRSYLKKTIEFDPDILKRYVSFMSNPDERTAIDQFGSGDKYFGVCTLLATLPGLPMFGHGQIEGYTERYGMEFKQAKMNEYPNHDLIARHQHEIAPLLKNRHIFAESTNFVLYDFWNDHGTVDENVFAYSNRSGGQRAVILYNNSYGSTRGTIHFSAASFDKHTGFLRQKSLADGLALPNDGSVFLAYRDTAHGLEYLIRTTDLHHHGLSIDLRGYQYAVLLDWRELRASADQPWDNLYYALNGAGVHSVEEALSKLRLRPLHEALRQALVCDNIQTFANVAAETAKKTNYALDQQSSVHVIADNAAKTSEKTELKKQPPLEAHQPEKIAPPKPEQSRINPINPRLEAFLGESHHFFHRVADELPSENTASPESHDFPITPETPSGAETTIHSAVSLLTEAQPASPKPAQTIPESIEARATATSQLVALSQTFSTAWPEAVRRVLPTPAKTLTHPEHVWGPILAWIILRSVPMRHNRAELFDKLHLRSALSEIFSSVGMEGESTWQAAAKVRVLLAHEGAVPTTLTHTDTFWNDPDVRWLAGVNESSGTTYFNKERFEELLCWLQLPALLKIAHLNSHKLESIIKLEVPLREACRSAKNAGYKLSEYLNPSIDGTDNNQPPGDSEAGAVTEVNQQTIVAQDVTVASQKR